MMSEPPPVHVFVVEDHEVMRDMLCDAVSRQPGCILTGAASSAEEALKRLPESGAHVALIDVSLPAMDGIQLVRELGVLMPGLHRLMVSGHVQADYATQALEAGAAGYVLKGRPSDLEEAISACLAGRTYLSEPLHAELREAADN